MRMRQPQQRVALMLVVGVLPTVEGMSSSLLAVGMIRGLCWYYGFALS
jgi:hypothetical protein